MLVTIATFNVNSVRQRLDALIAWLRECKADIVCLQELKCEDHAFPRLALEDAGYHLAVHGQKTFNGVAILSKFPIDDMLTGLPGDETDQQARYVEAVISLPGRAVRVASIYLPNGNPLESDKFAYKLGWMKRLRAHAQNLLCHEDALILAGDYNVIPDDRDCRDPAAWANDALARPESRQAWRALAHLGLTDALRAISDDAGHYTFWDYQAGAWQRDNGIRIDHLLLSPQAADCLRGVRIDKHVRGRDKPSDHVPVMAQFDFPAA